MHDDAPVRIAVGPQGEFVVMHPTGIKEFQDLRPAKAFREHYEKCLQRGLDSTEAFIQASAVSKDEAVITKYTADRDENVIELNDPKICPKCLRRRERGRCYACRPFQTRLCLKCNQPVEGCRC